MIINVFIHIRRDEDIRSVVIQSLGRFNQLIEEGEGEGEQITRARTDDTEYVTQRSKNVCGRIEHECDHCEILSPVSLLAFETSNSKIRRLLLFLIFGQRFFSSLLQY